MINRISHVGVIVRDLDETLELFERLFQLKPAVVKDAMAGKLRVAFVPVGNDEIELIQPLDPGIPFGQGIHHLSLSTDNIEADVERLKKDGVVFENDKPRIGAHGVKIILSRPETTGGITIELSEEKSPNSSG